MAFGYDISLSGLYASESALKVTQNNIANANTQGYAREVLNVQEQDASATTGINAQSGTGVLTDSVSRIKDDYLIQQTRNESAQVGYYKDLNTSLSDVQNAFSATSDNSINNTMQNFFNAWEDASKFPEDSSYRTALLGQAKLFTDSLNNVSSQIDTVQNGIDTQIKGNVDQINSLTQKIADINKQISTTMTDNPNTLIDQRDGYLDQLSQYINVDVNQNSNNTVDVRVGGTLLVSGTQSNAITPSFDNTNQKWILTASSGLALSPTKGSLSAELDARNNYIPSYENNLNTLVSSIASQVNSAHETGYGLDNSTGLDFFTGNTASTISVNSAIANDPEKIALSTQANTPGNGDNASTIAGIPDDNILDGGTTNPLSYYNGLVTNVGTDVSESSDNESVHSNVLTGIQDQQQNVQGVNIDEEMSNLMKYQQYYQANAKAITMVDQSFNSVMNIIQ